MVQQVRSRRGIVFGPPPPGAAAPPTPGVHVDLLVRQATPQRPHPAVLDGRVAIAGQRSLAEGKVAGLLPSICVRIVRPQRPHPAMLGGGVAIAGGRGSTSSSAAAWWFYMGAS